MGSVGAAVKGVADGETAGVAPLLLISTRTPPTLSTRLGVITGGLLGITGCLTGTFAALVVYAVVLEL